MAIFSWSEWVRNSAVYIFTPTGHDDYTAQFPGAIIITFRRVNAQEQLHCMFINVNLSIIFFIFLFFLFFY